MKRYGLFFVFFVVLTMFGQTKGIIYSMRIKVDPALVEEVKISTDRALMSGYSSRECFPDSLIEFLVVKTEEMLGKRFGVPFEAFYSYDKKGKKITTIGVNDELEGLPANTYKKAVASVSASHYVLIDAQLMGGGEVSFDLGGGTTSKIKPQVTVMVKVLDANKKKIYARSVTLRKLGKLRSKTDYFVNPKTGRVWTVTVSQTLSPMDVVSIYLAGLEHNLFNNK